MKCRIGIEGHRLERGLRCGGGGGLGISYFG